MKSETPVITPDSRLLTFIRRLRIRAARWLVRPLGLDVYCAGGPERITEALGSLETHVMHSGHLAHRYHIGRHLRAVLRDCRSAIARLVVE